MAILDTIVTSQYFQMMASDTNPPPPVRSPFTGISVLFAAVNALWFIVLVLGQVIGLYLDLISFLFILACPALTFIGIVSGGIAFFKNRSILGFLLNLPALLLTLLIVYYLLSASDGIPPEYR